MVIHMPKDDFVALDRLQVIIPYSDYEKMIKVVYEMEEMKRQYARLEEQYNAIRGMFSQCLDVVREIREFVKD